MPASDPPTASAESSERREPWIVGITGGVGAGKSFVAAMFAKLGARVIDADAIAREVTAQPEILARLRRAFGDGIIGPEDRLDRNALSETVFGGPDAESRVERLNAIVHPEVRRKIDKILEMWAKRGFDEFSPLPGKRPLVILDIPLLERSPYKDRTSTTLFIDTSLEDRLARVRKARRWSEETLRQREACQADLSEKRRSANGILPNPDGPQAERELRSSCQEWIRKWTQELEAHEASDRASDRGEMPAEPEGEHET